MQLDQYISELLYTNDCVILPGFGGFVANTKNAFLNPAQNTFSPPSKKIAFNAGLKTNDGLLAHYICQRESITFSEAVQKIQRYVDYCFEYLNSDKKLIFEKIGELHFDKEKNIQFEPDHSVNYLISSFGLTTIHSPSIKREGSATVRPIRSTNDKKKKVSAWRLLELVPVAAAFALLIINPKIVQDLNSSLSSVIPFGFEQPVEVTSPSQSSAFNPYTTQNSELQDASSTTDTSVTAELLQDPSATIDTKSLNSQEAIVPEKEVAKTETVSAVVENTTKVISEPKTIDTKALSTTDKSYYIIGGCFSIPENATNFVASAKAQGYDAKIIGLNDKGSQMVSLFQSESQQTARGQLATIKSSFDSTVWLYSK